MGCRDNGRFHLGIQIVERVGTRIAMGTTDKVIGYDVTYRFEGQDKTIRMDQKPGERLPVIDGQVVTQTASVDAPGQG